MESGTCLVFRVLPSSDRNLVVVTKRDGRFPSLSQRKRVSGSKVVKHLGNIYSCKRTTYCSILSVQAFGSEALLTENLTIGLTANNELLKSGIPERSSWISSAIIDVINNWRFRSHSLSLLRNASVDSLDLILRCRKVTSGI